MRQSRVLAASALALLVVLHIALQLLPGPDPSKAAVPLRFRAPSGDGVLAKDCADLTPECYEKAMAGHCISEETWMATHCSRSCYQDCQNAMGNADPELFGRMDSSNPQIKSMAKRNIDQTLYNKDKFPAVDFNSEDLVVIVIMVHTRVENLRPLLASLRKMKDVERSLLIISQDYNSDELDQLLDSVDFCLMMRIFLPASIQLHPSTYPGTDPKDCPVKNADGSWFSRSAAQQLGCTNKDYPDKYGHYREAKYAAIKHHWWWKLAFVFEHIRILKNHPGFKILLEEDNYLAPDTLSTVALLRDAMKTKCTDCSLFSLGIYGGSGAANAATRFPWDPTKHNMGMGFNKTTWEHIKACGRRFCTYDDYNWDWTMLRLSSDRCFGSGNLNTLVLDSPRAFHTGTSCGVHQQNRANCNPQAVVDGIEARLSSSEHAMYPASLNVDVAYRPVRDAILPNGGWGDHRDRDLCLTMAYGKADL